AAGVVNNWPGVPIITMQSLVAIYAMFLTAYHPDIHVVGSISRGGERRAATVIAPRHAPTVRDVDRGRIGCSNAESCKCGAARTEGDITALLRTISHCGLYDGGAGNMSRGYRCFDPAEITAIKQVCI